ALFLAHRSFSQEEVVGDALFVNQNYCVPPLPHEEVISTANSVFSYVDGEKAEKIRAMRNSLNFGIWEGVRGKNIKSVLRALLTEYLDRYTLFGDEVEVSISYSRISEKTGLSYTTVKKIIKEMTPEYLKRGREPKGKKCGTLILKDESVGYPINISNTNERTIIGEGGLYIGELPDSSLFLLELNSQRRGNLGKSACMVLELLMERSHTRMEIEEKLGYKRNGACHTLDKLKNRKGLILSEDGLYSLAGNFFELLKEEIEINLKDIEVLRKRHQVKRDDYHLRLEAWDGVWDEAAKEFHGEILPTAKESGGAYLFWIAHNRNSIIKSLAGSLAYVNYVELKAAQRSEND
ncbi:MAG: hypothetical protein Q9192_009066, partial [Flavoplaca navasiana]